MLFEFWSPTSSSSSSSTNLERDRSSCQPERLSDCRCKGSQHYDAAVSNFSKKNSPSSLSELTNLRTRRRFNLWTLSSGQHWHSANAAGDARTRRRQCPGSENTDRERYRSPRAYQIRWISTLSRSRDNLCIYLHRNDRKCPKFSGGHGTCRRHECRKQV